MNLLRWIACFPAAFLASYVGWGFALRIFSGVSSTYGDGVISSLVGLLPLVTEAAIPTVVFVLAGVTVAPSKERRVCFVFFGLSLLFSGGGIHLLQHQNGYFGFWLASAGGIIVGAIIGLAASLRIQRLRRPIQLPEPTSGLAPGRGSS
jgi:hypothetical protein